MVSPFVEACCLGPVRRRWKPDPRFREVADLNEPTRGRAKFMHSRPLQEGDTHLARAVRRVGVGRLGNHRLKIRVSQAG